MANGSHGRRQRGRHRRRLHARTIPSSTSSIRTGKLAALESAVQDAGQPVRKEGAGVLRQRHDARPASTTRRNCAPPSTRRSAATWRSTRWTRAAWWRRRRWAMRRRPRRAARACTPAVRSGPAQSNFQGQQETLYTLAADTGGKALLDNNDLSLGIVQAQKDISSYYILGYYSTNDKHGWPLPPHQGAGQPRSLRAPSSITARAISPPRNSSSSRRPTGSAKLQEALMLGDPVTGSVARHGGELFPPGTDRYFVPVSVKIPGSESNWPSKAARRARGWTSSAK